MTNYKDIKRIPIVAADVPNLDTAKITTGTFANARISESSVTAHASDYIDWQSVVTASTLTAVAGRGYPINTISNACTVTLPASASVGDTIKFVDYARSWGTNALTLTSSLNFQGSSSIDPVYNTNGQAVTITYVDVTKGWIPTVDDDVTDESAVASGGTETTYSSGGTDYKVHTFLTSGTFQVLTAKAMDIMMIAGGGGGGAWHSGGGGAGGMIVAASASNTIAVASYSIVIGAGATATLYDGNNGSNTTGFSDTATGGGGSGYYLGNNSTSGGSGGGARGQATSSGGTGTQGNPSTLSGTGYGNDGGDSAHNHDGGGGGGAGAAGSDASSGVQGDGGLGLDNLYRTGSNVTYAGGGEGGTWSGSRQTDHNGLAGGGGIGGAGNEATAPTAGAANKGAGGGGRGGNTASNVTAGGNGGSGIVVIRYAV